MRSLLACVAFGGISTFAQPVIGGAGYSPTAIPVAPGQIITLFVQSANSDITGPVRASGSLPATLAGISVTYRQVSDHPAAMLAVQPISSCLGFPPAGSACNTTLAVTAQLPFDMLTLCPICGRPDIPAYVFVSVKGVTSALYSVQPLNDQVHILTSCDIFLIPSDALLPRNSALPCSPIVTHLDGKVVTASSPAKGGEVLVAWAIGLGQTGDPSATAGQPPVQSSATQTAFGIDFNYRPNALATKPLGPNFFGVPTFAYPMPLFTGATAGFAGLYQINFIVAPPPAGLSACAPSSVPYSNIVQSNLTVSIGSAFSFDGAGICVQPGS
jgi:hypothetical protein